MVCHLRKTKDNDIDREDVLVAVKTEWESLNLQQIAAGVKKCGGITPQKSAVKSAVKDKDNACEMHISQAFYVVEVRGVEQLYCIAFSVIRYHPLYHVFLDL